MDAAGIVSDSAGSSYLVSPAPLAPSPDVKAPGGALDFDFPSTPRPILQTVQKLTSVKSRLITVNKKTFPRSPDDY